MFSLTEIVIKLLFVVCHNIVHDYFEYGPKNAFLQYCILEENTVLLILFLNRTYIYIYRCLLKTIRYDMFLFVVSALQDKLGNKT